MRLENRLHRCAAPVSLLATSVSVRRRVLTIPCPLLQPFYPPPGSKGSTRGSTRGSKASKLATPWTPQGVVGDPIQMSTEAMAPPGHPGPVAETLKVRRKKEGLAGSPRSVLLSEEMARMARADQLSSEDDAAKLARLRAERADALRRTVSVERIKAVLAVHPALAEFSYNRQHCEALQKLICSGNVPMPEDWGLHPPLPGLEDPEIGLALPTWEKIGLLPPLLRTAGLADDGTALGSRWSGSAPHPLSAAASHRTAQSARMPTPATAARLGLSPRLTPRPPPGCGAPAKGKAVSWNEVRAANRVARGPASLLGRSRRWRA